MALSQPPRPDRSQSRPTLGRALLWPAAAVGMGALLIHNSLASPEDPKPPTPPAAVAESADVDPPAEEASPATVTPPVAAPTSTTDASPTAVVPPMAVPNAVPGPPGPGRQTLPRSVPKRLAIPQIGVNAPFTGLSLAASGQLNAPPLNNTNLVGWYKNGASPGERGASIVVGHVDTKTGPAVFVLLRTLKPGSRVVITRADGIVVSFKVDSVDTFSKANFPNDRVYADTPTPELRLITCGGIYNRSAHEYESNVVVFAHLASVKRPPGLPSQHPGPVPLTTRATGKVPMPLS